MNRRHLVMAVCLLVAGWLAFFGDKTPNSDIAQPVVKKPGRAAIGRPASAGATASRPASAAAANTGASGNSTRNSARAQPDIGIAQLLPREELLGATAKDAVKDTDKAKAKAKDKTKADKPVKPRKESGQNQAANKGKDGKALVPIAIAPAPPPPPPETLFGSQSWTPPPAPPRQAAAPPPPTAPPLPFTYLGKKSEDNQWEIYLARGSDTFIVREQTVIEGRYRIDAIKPPTLTVTYLPLNQVQTLTIGGTD